ncbi:unnamed protein product [Amoebophrya sp. A25]|nr:unnamed protein product [Amoebophrya sp. A25]|eukprot:GSA25T00008722001.1
MHSQIPHPDAKAAEEQVAMEAVLWLENNARNVQKKIGQAQKMVIVMESTSSSANDMAGGTSGTATTGGCSVSADELKKLKNILSAAPVDSVSKKAVNKERQRQTRELLSAFAAPKETATLADFVTIKAGKNNKGGKRTDSTRVSSTSTTTSDEKYVTKTPTETLLSDAAPKELLLPAEDGSNHDEVANYRNAEDGGFSGTGSLIRSEGEEERHEVDPFAPELRYNTPSWSKQAACVVAPSITSSTTSTDHWDSSSYPSTDHWDSAGPTTSCATGKVAVKPLSLHQMQNLNYISDLNLATQQKLRVSKKVLHYETDVIWDSGTTGSVVTRLSVDQEAKWVFGNKDAFFTPAGAVHWDNDASSGDKSWKKLTKVAENLAAKEALDEIKIHELDGEDQRRHFQYLDSVGNASLIGRRR